MSTSLPTLIGLGRLVDFIIRDNDGQRLRATPRGERWLAWKADTRDLVVLLPGGGRGSHPNRSDAKRHYTFHGAEPQRSRHMKWPASSGGRRTLGRIEAVTYTADGIRSPSKGSHHWVHQFGDHGERGHGPARSQKADQYSYLFCPLLEIDEAGNLFVVRCRSNRYLVRNWIIG